MIVGRRDFVLIAGAINDDFAAHRLARSLNGMKI